ncbi:hypothetical protein [Sphingopyxis fribergensis]
MFGDLEPFAAPARRGRMLLQHDFDIEADEYDQGQSAEQADPAEPPRKPPRHGK